MCFASSSPFSTPISSSQHPASSPAWSRFSAIIRRGPVLMAHLPCSQSSPGRVHSPTPAAPRRMTVPPPTLNV